MVRIIWSETALNDLKAIREYIGHDSPKFARLQINKIRKRVKILQSNPLAGKENPEMHISSIRELIEGNYRIIYEMMNKNQISILMVHHGARDLPDRLK